MSKHNAGAQTLPKFGAVGRDQYFVHDGDCVSLVAIGHEDRREPIRNDHAHLTLKRTRQDSNALIATAGHTPASVEPTSQWAGMEQISQAIETP